MASKHLVAQAPSARQDETGTQPATHRARSTRRGFSLQRRMQVTAWAFMVPLLLINGLVIIGPSLASVYFSFTDWSGLGDAHWVGLANFQHLLVDNEFHAAFIHNLIWTAIFLVVPLTMGLTGAFLLSQITRFGLFFRIAFFLPYTVSTVVSSTIWQDLMNPERGLGRVFPFLRNTYFLGDERSALPSVAFINNWAFWGFLLVIFLAAMQSVSTELYDAANVDGANRWQQFVNVTLPGIRPTLVFIVLIITIWSLITFDFIYITTHGGPAGSTEVVTTLLYRTAFTRNEAGYAAAMALSLVFITGIVVGIFTYLRRKGWEI